MRTGWLLAIWLCWGISPASGQQSLPAPTNHIVVATNIIEPSPRAAGLFLLDPVDNSYSDRFVLTKNISVSGPLVGPAKARSFSDFARRVVHLVNPFGSGGGSPAVSLAEPVSSRAWTSMVGWTPGASAFPTEAHHDPPALRLISFSAEKQP